MLFLLHTVPVAFSADSMLVRDLVLLLLKGTLAEKHSLHKLRKRGDRR